MSFERCLVLLFLICASFSNGRAQEDDSALSDYVRFYRKFLHREPGNGNCAMYPSCSRYGLMVFEDCYFPKAMVYVADRMIRCGHDFDAYDLTLQEGRLSLLDLPPYVDGVGKYVYKDRDYYAYTDWTIAPDSSLLFVNYLLNRQMYNEALTEIERLLFQRKALTGQLFVNKLICYKGLGLSEEAIYDYEMRFPDWAKRCPDVKFEMLELLLSVENYKMGRELIAEIPDTSEKVVCARKYAWQGLLFAKEEKWDEAAKAFGDLARVVPNAGRDARNLQLLNDASTFPRKKRGVAAALSVVPGLGYIYTKRPKSALTAFAMNALLGYAVYTSIKKENYGVAALMGVFNLSFYVGNISGAGRSARQHNQRKLEKIQSALYKNNQFIN